MGKNIPKATKQNFIPFNKNEFKNKQGCEGNLIFSFSMFEQNNYFSVSDTCEKWTSSFLSKLGDLSKISIKQFNSDTAFRKTNRVHNCSDAKLPCKIPRNISKDDLIQVSIMTSKGRIIGTVVENIFYIVWLDPHHNMYPNENKGGLTEHDVPTGCCCQKKMSELYDLQKENRTLREKKNEQQTVHS